MNFNAKIVTSICIALLCLSFGCANKNEEEHTETVANLQSENATLQDRLASNAEQRKQLKELRQLVVQLTKDKQSLRARLGIAGNAASSEKIASWRGSGIKTTKPFTITKSPWVIAWSNSGGGYLSIFASKANGRIVSMAANTMKDGKDVSYVYETGTFYLEINGSKDWTVKVYQAL
ncbi:hypothetical protein LCGC14_1367810 [marine sediment metagenome]|uniref:Lipoprotein n=1 Tax=marine sediment metagenome TaxID=412755 RepID=A0A0F9MLD7_9ZZZZ